MLIKIKCIAIGGNFKGSRYDLDLDPVAADINENPGSIPLYITLGEFEFYTAGDIHIYVAEDGRSHRVYFREQYDEYSAVDGENVRVVL